MFYIRKTAAALCLSGLAISGMAVSASAATASASRNGGTPQAVDLARTCNYEVVNAPHGLNVRAGPGTQFRVLGVLRDHARATGECGAVRDWIHLFTPIRGYSFARYLAKR